MTEIREKDAMICRSCANEERASEGYPCVECGTFICLMCSFRGILKCRRCTAAKGPEPTTPTRQIPQLDWPEH